MVTIQIKSNIDQIERSLNDVARKELPFATAQAVNAQQRLFHEGDEESPRVAALDRRRAEQENPVGEVAQCRSARRPTPAEAV